MTLELGVRTVAIILAAGAACAMTPRAFAQTTNPDTAAIAQGDLNQIAATLNSPTDSPVEQRDRDEAAKKLVSRQSPEARAILLRALLSGDNPASQLAVAKAVGEDHQPDPTLVEPLINALRTSRTNAAARNLPDAAARALVNYRNPDVLPRLIALVEKVPREPEPLRRDIIHALGFSDDKRSARTLVNVLRTADEPDAIRKAAAAALTEMSGLTDFGQDSQRWSEWLASNIQKPDADFRNEIIARRAAGADQARQALAELSSEIHDLLNKQYQAIPANQQPDFLLTHLRSQLPAFRAETALIIEEDVAEGKRPPEPVRVQLRAMIGDSDPKVRINIARTLATINDDGALQFLLAQVTQEKDGLVRAQLARALGTINKLEAGPTLIEMLKDPSVAAATEAARAIGQLGEHMVQEKSLLIAPAAQALREAFERQRPDGGNSEFREALLAAMVPLKQASLSDIFYDLLRKSDPSVQIRRLAIKALGEIGDPKAAATIVNAMQDKAAANVRVEAVIAFGKLSNANENVAALIQLAKNEPEDSVRSAAWNVLQIIMPSLTIDDIQNIVLLYKDDWSRQFQAQKTLEDIYRNLNKKDDLAILQQNMGMTLLNLKEYQGAAEYFKNALNYKKEQKTPGSETAIQSLREKRVKALLEARQYDEAIAFAGESIRDSDENQVLMGTAIIQYVRQLQTQKNYEDALKLIDGALGPKMEPQLLPPNRQTLREAQDQIRRQSGAPAATAPAAP